MLNVGKSFWLNVRKSFLLNVRKSVWLNVLSLNELLNLLDVPLVCHGLKTVAQRETKGLKRYASEPKRNEYLKLHALKALGP